MKKLAVIFMVALLATFGFQQVHAQKNKALTIDEVLEQALDLSDTEVVVTGTVMHVCKHGGGRCFLMGSNEDVTIRVEAGESIGAFTQEQMGSDLEIVGILKEVKTEADAHNPGKQHGEEEEHEEDEQTEQAHAQIAKNQEASERIFFIEGLKVKELN